MISPVAERLLRDLDKNEIKLLRWLLSSKIVDRQKALVGMRKQVVAWTRSPQHLTPLSQKQWQWLLSQRINYRRYEELLKKLK